MEFDDKDSSNSSMTNTNNATNTDWDDAFDNMGHIPDAASYPAMWATRAAAYRDTADFAELDIAYGEHDRAVLDMFWPDGKPKGLAVFLHGGYWLRLDKSYWSDLASGARQNGWAVAIPSYVLTPEARISEITDQIGRAITTAAQKVSGPVHLAGHSAGGHLATRMISNTSPLSPAILSRINHVLSISGVHDLRPLLHTRMNDTLRLTRSEAEAESVCLLTPASGIAVTCWVGAEERPEFVKQSKALADIWGAHGCQTALHVEPGKHHFTVLDNLRDPGAPITRAFAR